MGLQEAEVFIPSHDLCTPESGDMPRSTEERIQDLFINQRYAECHGIGTMSNGSMSPDLGEMWHHGYLVSPQWGGDLELDSASDGDRTYGAMVHEGLHQHHEGVFLIRDFLCPPDVIRLRIAERRWNLRVPSTTARVVEKFPTGSEIPSQTSVPQSRPERFSTVSDRRRKCSDSSNGYHMEAKDHRRTPLSSSNDSHP